MARRILAAAMALSALCVVAAPAAHADISGGTCTMTFQFSFSPPLKFAALSQLTATSYSFGTVSDTLDLNPLTPEQEVCAITPVGVPSGTGFLFYATGASGAGSSELGAGIPAWTCEQIALGSGSYSQGWSHSDPMPAPPSISGSHGITGTWDAWTMEVNDFPTLTAVGVMELTVHPLDTAKLAQCATTGVSTLRLIGQLVFQDP